jgi:hypothetical protein
MKTLYLFLAYVLCSTLICAQPVLQYPQNAPAIGDVVEIQFVDAEGLTPGASGPGVTWDYSGLTNTGEEGSISVIEPAAAPAGGSFPDANIVMDMNDTIFTYSMVDNTGLYYHGAQVTSGVMPVLFVYSDHRTYLEYPFTYNDAFSDTYRGVSSVMMTEIRLTATSEVIADAYGTLTIPSGTFNDVLRIKTMDTEIDSIFVKGTFISEVITERTQYHWFAPNSKSPLFSLEYSDCTGSLDTCSYYTTSVAGISDPVSQFISGLRVFPNPAIDRMEVSFETAGYLNGRISIVNHVGQLVISKEIPSHAMGTITEEFDVSALAPGIYFAHVNCSGEMQATAKFVIR